MKYKLGKNTSRNLHTLKSEMLILAVEGFIHHTPIDFCVLESGGFRTAEEQNKLFKKGVSKCDGYKLISNHQNGTAVDLVPWVNNKPTWQREYAYGLAMAFMCYCKMNNLAITSGADWNDDGNLSDGWDPCHMEMK